MSRPNIIVSSPPKRSGERGPSIPEKAKDGCAGANPEGPLEYWVPDLRTLRVLVGDDTDVVSTRWLTAGGHA